MPRADERLEHLEDELRARGSDRLRLELVRRARVFKRSWVEMAEALLRVRSAQLYERWGYSDFHTYCQQELLLTPQTVDKLTGSYSTVQDHAPHVLERDGIDKPIPTIDAVDYFARALRETQGDEAGDSPEEDVIEELKHAVFDDNKSVAALRRTFNPLFFPKPEGSEQVETLEKTRAAIRRLEGLLQRAVAIGAGLDDTKVERLLKALASLRDDLVDVVPEARAGVEQRAS